MSYRKIPLVEGEIYHIFTKSIANFKVFNTDKDFERMVEAMAFYRVEKPPCKFSLLFSRPKQFSKDNIFFNSTGRIIKVLAYCIMPTHIHLILQSLKENAISRYINLILKSYSKYFNLKHNRQGPLWEGRFKNVLVKTDEYLLHLTRYVHLNPTTAFLVNNLEDWRFSSCKEYINLVEEKIRICEFSHCLEIEPHSYKKFVNDRISYQRELGKIKHLLMD